jgi:3-hydroxymyristoyl/3-hydroxydecanoyl-(acyl carrier protein) dehydratase
MRADLAFTIEPNHPSLAGHFPGRPIVPGVVILDRILCLLLGDRPGQRVSTLREVKLLAPVLPGDAVTIEIVDSLGSRVTFIGKVGQLTVLRGQVQLDKAT